MRRWGLGTCRPIAQAVASGFRIIDNPEKARQLRMAKAFSSVWMDRLGRFRWHIACTIDGMDLPMRCRGGDWC
jgi:hypothetical protein